MVDTCCRSRNKRRKCRRHSWYTLTWRALDTGGSWRPCSGYKGIVAGFAWRFTFVKQCLHCLDSQAGEKVPRPLRETVHGTSPGEVFHFNCLHIRDSGHLGKDGLDEVQIHLGHDGRFEQFLVVEIHGIVHGSVGCEASTEVM